MATKGAEGTPPAETSLYLPNAGHYVMRTGWGPVEKYLFFGAGPWGASHGKMDALNVYAQFGNHLLIRNAGRGSYSGIGNTKHAGRSLSFNTLSPDWAQENSIPYWKAEMHIGFHPPKRRWISNERFDYGEGAFDYGWHNAAEHIRGKWVRQVIFVKGGDARKEGYHLVVDTVEPADTKPRTWRHPWQLGLNAPNIATRETDRNTTAITPGAALQILPVGDMTLRVIQGQETPELLGWRIYDTIARPWPVPTYEWLADGTFSRAWVIQMQANESEWPVVSVEMLPSENLGELRCRIRLRDGGTEEVLRRFPSSKPAVLGEDEIVGDIAVVSQNADGEVVHYRRDQRNKNGNLLDGERHLAHPFPVSASKAECLMGSKLSAPERKAWKQHLRTIQRGWDTFVEVGQALKEIRENRLYREEFPTWEAFCRQIVGSSKTQANRQIQASALVIEMREMTPNGVKSDPDLPLPANEAQARVLAPIKGAEKRWEVWEAAVRQSDGNQVSAEMIQEIAVEKGVIEKPERRKQPAKSSKEKRISPEPLREVRALLEQGLAEAKWSRIREALKLIDSVI